MPYSSFKARRPSRSSFSGNNFSRSGGRSGGSKRRVKQNIHPSKFIKAAKPVAEIIYEATHSFSDFEIHDLIKSNIDAKGFTTPSPIQDQAIPHALVGRDVIGVANTGTGKTAAFGIPLLHRLMADSANKALIMAPTRELALQIEEELKTFAKGSGLMGAMLIGGSPMSPQLRQLRSNPSIVIGTPGRIKDHTERGTLRLDDFNIVVLDEVDRMVDMGFIADIRHILSLIAKERQSLFFSATIEKKIEELINTFMVEPVMVSVKTSITSDNVHQDVVQFGSIDEKIAKLHDILIQDEVKKVLVFDDTQRDVERLSDELIDRGFKADAIHGGKTQGHRQRALSRFKESNISILVATDVAARGIDVSDVTHVINYSTPTTYDDYIHRIGRAGRAGRVGHALTFISRY